MRKTVSEGCEKLIWNFFDGGGQVVIYDANNGSRAQRQSIAERFDKKGIHVIYLGESTSVGIDVVLTLYALAESLCDNKEIIETNIRNVKISSPDVRYGYYYGLGIRELMDGIVSRMGSKCRCARLLSACQ